MPDTLPISAILVFRNERDMLRECLPRLWFCRQLILVDMESTDGSVAEALRHVERVYHHQAQPIADPARVWACQFATQPWLLTIDPDEHYPPELVEELRQAMAEHPRAGGFRLPLRFYFKRRYLPGTVWGGDHISKLAVVHHQRGRFLPWCNRISEVRPGYETVHLPNTRENHIRHYWSNSYRDLWDKHWRRYPQRDAQRLRGEGVRYTPAMLWRDPLRKFIECYRHRDGRRMGVRGLLLSLIFAGYHAAIAWRLRQLCRTEAGELPAPSSSAAAPDPTAAGAVSAAQEPIQERRAA